MDGNENNENQNRTESSDDLGERVRELRLERNLTIKELAALSGISVNALSLIENCKSSPSVSTLRLLASALQVAMPKFFEPKKEEKSLVFTPVHQRIQIKPDPLLCIESLCHDLSGNVLDASVISLLPGGKSGFIPSHSGYELVYCLTGKILFSVEDEHFVLEQGDSIAFFASVKHKFKNLEESTTQILVALADSQIPGSFTIQAKHLLV